MSQFRKGPPVVGIAFGQSDQVMAPPNFLYQWCEFFRLAVSFLIDSLRRWMTFYAIPTINPALIDGAGRRTSRLPSVAQLENEFESALHQMKGDESADS